MEEKRKRLNQAVDWLVYKHMAGSISEIAEKAGVNRSHFSSVLKDKSKPVTDGMLLKLCAAYAKLDFEWLSKGKGNPLVKQDVSISGKNIVNGNATNSIVGDIHDLNVQMPNKYGDSPSEERKWAPVVPTSMAKAPGFDILGHISKQMGGGMADDIDTVSITVSHNRQVDIFVNEIGCINEPAINLADNSGFCQTAADGCSNLRHRNRVLKVPF